MFGSYFNKKKVATVFLAVVFLALTAFSFFPFRNSFKVEFANPARNDVLQVFCDLGNGFTEGDSRSAVIRSAAMHEQDPLSSSAIVPLPPKKIKAIRIDPGTTPEEWGIKSICLESKFGGRKFYSHTWSPEDIARDFIPLHAIDVFEVRNNVLVLNASEADPHFGYKEDFGKVYNPLWRMMRHFKVTVWIMAAILGLLLVLLNNRVTFMVGARLLGSTKKLFRPFSEARFVFPLWFWVVVFGFALIKIWLVSSQAFPANSAPHDDELYLRLARSIAAGQWLGEYNNLTLLKAHFYSIWIAAMFWIGIPLSLSQHLLYICSCLLFVIAVRPLLRNIPLLLLIVFVTLTFHPISYAGNSLARVLREGIYISLPLLVLSFVIGILLRKGAPVRKLVIWNIGLGLSFAAFWLTREEGVLVVPSLLLLLCAFIVSVLLYSQDKLKRIMTWLISMGIALAIISTVAGVNKVYYDIFTTSEQMQQDFLNAYSALLRVKPQPFQRYNFIPREMRKRVYAVSPAFAELQPFLEGDIGKGWSQWGPYAGEDMSTHFMFAFRDAVASAGYYNSGDATVKYYSRLASEVNDACDEGFLDCYKRDNSFIPKSAYKTGWRGEYFEPLMITLKKMVVSVARLEGIAMTPRPDSGDVPAILYLFQDVTRDRIAPRRSDLMAMPCQQQVDIFKINILNSLLSFFRFFMPALTALGGIFYIWHIVSILLKRRIDFSFIVITALLLAVLARIYLMSLVEVTMVPDFIGIIIYKSSLFPLLAAFSIVSILTVFLSSPESCTFPLASMKSKKFSLKK